MKRKFGEDYPTIFNLIDLIRTIPATCTAHERGFTHKKLVKSDKRAPLKECTLSDCLIIRVEWTSMKDFNPVKVITLWFESLTEGLVVVEKSYNISPFSKLSRIKNFPKRFNKQLPWRHVFNFFSFLISCA